MSLNHINIILQYFYYRVFMYSKSNQTTPFSKVPNVLFM